MKRLTKETITSSFFLVLLLVSSMTISSAFAGETQVYAIIVGNNDSLDKDVSPLRFADDDAAKYFEFFTTYGADVTLLAVLDPDAQGRFPEAADVSRPPSKRELDTAVSTVFAKMKQDMSRGHETHFYFLYSGHGNVGPNREGYINLLDERFFRSQLYREILAHSPASFNHIILDACHSYFLVEKRGAKKDKKGDYRKVVRDFLRAEDLRSYPNTGVILAASSESETHEWGRWEAGIFSHELRSALLGGADVNGNKQVTYAEAASCVDAANSAIDVPRARLKVYYQPPKSKIDVPLVDLTKLSRSPRLELNKKLAGQYHVEDARGIRIADFNFSEEQPLTFSLVGKAPFYIRKNNTEAIVEAPGETLVVADGLQFYPLSSRSRGSVEKSFRRHLYAVPFGISFFRGAVAMRKKDHYDSEPSLPYREENDNTPSSKRLKIIGWSTLGAGVLAGAGSGLMYALAHKAHEEYELAGTSEEAGRLRKLSQNRLLTSRILLGTGAALAAAGASLLIIDAVREKRATRSSGQLALLPTSSGFFLSFHRSF